MEKKHFKYKSKDGITDINAVCFIPEKVDIILQISHGMIEYIDRYERFSKFMNKHNIMVVGNDHLGHGNSVINNKKWGYFSVKDGNKIVIEDMHSLVKIMKNDYSEKPYFILGFSMGSFLLRQYLCSYGDEIDGAIIMGTGYQPSLKLKFGKFLAKIIARIKGWEYRSKLLHKIAFDGFNKRFKNDGETGKEWLSRDKDEVFKYISDERCSFIFTVNGYYNLFNATYEACNKEYLKNIPKNLPIFILSGGDDPVGDFGKGVLKIYKMIKNNGNKNIKFKIYKDYRHEILNEIDREAVYCDILNWIFKISKKNK